MGGGEVGGLPDPGHTKAAKSSQNKPSQAKTSQVKPRQANFQAKSSHMQCQSNGGDQAAMECILANFRQERFSDERNYSLRIGFE